MRVWFLGLACLAGAALIAFGSARLRLGWPLAILSLLLAAISLQLYLAATGQGGFHDLGAYVAQAFTTAPALIGIVTALLLARINGHPARWRGLAGALTALGLMSAAAAIAATFLL